MAVHRVVFAHGGAVDPGAFQGILERLDRRYEIVADHRPTAAQLAGAVAPGTALVGASFGGGLALQAACRAPIAPVLVVVIGPFVPTSPYPPDQARAEALMAAARLGPQAFADAALADTWFSVGVHEEQREALRSMLARNAPLQPGRLPLDPPEVSEDELANLAAPVIVLVGELDDPANKATCLWLADTLPRAELREIPGVGHLVEVAAPASVADAITSRT